MSVIEPRPRVIDAIPKTVARLRASFATGRTRPLEYRQHAATRR